MILTSVVSHIRRALSSSAASQLTRAMAATLVRHPLPADSLSKFVEIRDTPEVQVLREIFKSSGFELRIAGGAVRDLLTGVIPHDVDFATTASPEEMIKILSPYDEKQIRIITTKAGQRHGSITTRINEKALYEITTLRIDKKTDGRHADVEFVKDWALDASRRDLTINAMFLDFDGTVIDYFNGIDDLRNKLIRFVGDPSERVREDYLRIFRYFRFYVRYGCLIKHDEKTIAAIRSNRDGLNQISGERIWAETKRLLKLKQCNSIMPLLMNDLKIGPFMGIKSHPVDLAHYGKVHDSLFSETPDPFFEPVTALTALVKDEDELNECAKRLRFSGAERCIAMYIMTNRDDADKISLMSIQKQLALASKSEQNITKTYVLEFLRYINRYDLLKEIGSWEIPQFPIHGDILKEKMRGRTGREIGSVINRLKSAWAHNNFSLADESVKQIIDEALEQQSNCH